MTNESGHGQDAILWELQARHLDEAQFALDVWEQTLDSPDYTLDELEEGPEQRLLAHVDALRLGGPLVAERLLDPAIRSPHGWAERGAVAVLACEDPEPAIEALRTATDEEQVRGLVRGLELREDLGLDDRLIEALRDEPGTGMAAFMEVLARRRVELTPWPEIPRESLADARVAIAAARLARFCSENSALDVLIALAQHEDPFVRDAAIESGLFRRLKWAWNSMVHWALTDEESPARRQALARVACLGDEATRRRVIELVGSPVHRVDALWAAGFTGDAFAVERCMSLLGDKELGPVAAEVVCAIAGLPTSDAQYWRAPEPSDDPEAGLPPLGADNLDADLSLSPEDYLPRPLPEAIEGWWHEHKPEFDPSVRYLGGSRFDSAALHRALRVGPLRRRHILAFELEIRSAGQVHLATRGLSHVQRAQLDRLDQTSLDYQRGYR